MAYKLFIDDERFPAQSDWTIARSSNDAKWYLMNKGCPSEMALDHDLGEEDTVMVFLKWFEESLHLKLQELPSDFKWSIHSQNPIGRESTRLFMEDLVRNYLTHH